MLKKVIGGTFLIIILAVVTFYFTASSSWESEAKYHQLRTWERPETQPGDTLTAMTYNIGYLSGMTNNLPVPRLKALFDENLSQAKTVIALINPDIIGFQEIDYLSNRSFNVQQLDELAKSSNYSHALQSINWDRRYVPFPYWPPEHQFGKMLSGQTILAKGSLSIDQVVTLPKPVNAPFYYNAFYLDRLVQIADWEMGGTTIKVMNLHLEAFDKETRIIHAKAVKELYESYAKDMPVILMGDFNSPPAILEEEDGMDFVMSTDNIASAIPDSLYASNPSAYFTFDSDSPTKMIDFILYNPSHIQPIHAFVPRAGEISDHLPVVFKFKLINQEL